MFYWFDEVARNENKKKVSMLKSWINLWWKTKSKTIMDWLLFHIYFELDSNFNSTIGYYYFHFIDMFISHFIKEW